MNNRSLFVAEVTNKWQHFIHSDVRQDSFKKTLATIVSIIVAFFIAFIFSNTVCRTWSSAGKYIEIIFTCGFESIRIDTLLSNMSIFIVAGLSFIFAYKSGLFNIGISGQMIAGGTIATIVCHMGHLGAGANQFVILLLAIIFGALMATIIGALKAYLGVHEVVSSIMLNWIIYYMSILLLANLPIPHDASNLNTAAPANELLLRMNGESTIPLLIIAGILILFVAITIKFTVFGKKQRATGLNDKGALAAGYNVKLNKILSMTISGALAGIMGAMMYCGFSPNMPVTAAAKAIPQEGFNGISVGLISMCNPIAALPVSLFFSMVRTSINDLQMIGIDSHIGDVVFGIIVYGAASISLFANLKPYWFTIEIFKGKTYSRIKHERNMTNIELLNLSSDEGSMLRRHHIYYNKNHRAKSTIKYSPLLHIRMWIGSFRFWLTTKRVKYRVWKNQKVDLITGNKFFKQEMAHIVKQGNYAIVSNKLGNNGWYVKLTDDVTSSNLKKVLEEKTLLTVTPKTIQELFEIRAKFKTNPFNSNQIRMVSRLAYLQNLRSGLEYRIRIAQQNKFAFFTFMQTKQHEETLGLGEIRTKYQLLFARSAFYKAYDRTFKVVKAHYDTMEKVFGKKKELDIATVRFDSNHLVDLYYKNLRSEIAELSYLINCPLEEHEGKEVVSLIKLNRKAKMDVYLDRKKAKECRKTLKYLFKQRNKKNSRVVRKYLDKYKNYNNNIINNRQSIVTAKERIRKIISNVWARERILQRQKWLEQKRINERASKKLAKIKAKRIKKGGKYEF